MTTTIVVGEQTKPVQLQKIVFERFLNGDLTISNSVDRPSSYQYIELIAREYASGKDLMFAYNDTKRRGGGILYIGKWNDGIV